MDGTGIHLRAKVAEVIHLQQDWNAQDVMDLLRFSLGRAAFSENRLVRLDEKISAQVERRGMILHRLNQALEIVLKKEGYDTVCAQSKEEALALTEGRVDLLLVDIYNRAKKLHIQTEVRRAVFIIETGREKDTGSLESLRALFGSKSHDFITAVDEKNIIVVKELAENEGYPELNKTAKVMHDLLVSETEQRVHIAYGTSVGEIKEVSRSYKEAKMALDVGKIFFDDRKVIAYSTLGIGRLIYQLPIPLCKMFIREIFNGKSPEDLDEETLTTINKFFDNNLNVSETSRQLYIHRNTLVYRLDKLQKSTGLDLRTFDDAITFKIALMVVKYMSYIEKMDH